MDMLSSMEVAMIRSLAERGVSISAIARQMNIDRKTVRHALKAPTPTPERDAPPSVLDPYKAYLRGRLEVADFTAQRLYQDLQTQGYKGGYNLVKRFVAPLRTERHSQAVVRFETVPGQQAQVDWASFGLMVVDGVRKVLSCFSMILGFSRYQYIEFTLSRNLASFLTCHVHAFDYFGGVPAEVLYDNLKTAVLSHVDGTVEWQSTFTDFAAYYGFTPRACRPYRAQTKGKVERPFPYIRSNFFLGRTFAGVENVNAQSRHWLDHTANVRVHGTTHERPQDRYQIERGHLRSLPQQAYRTVESTFRSSTRDCVVSYGGNFYSVPARYAARRQLRVEVSPAELTIYHNAEKIAVHRLCHGRHHRIIDPKHLEGLVVEATLTPLQHKLRELRALGPAAAAFIDGLVKSQTRLLPWHVGRLRETLFKVGPELLQQAMERATRFQAYDARTVQKLCDKLRLQRCGGVEPVPIGAVLTKLMARLAEGQVQARNLQDYEVVHAPALEG
jgi:transposase